MYKNFLGIAPIIYSKITDNMASKILIILFKNLIVLRNIITQQTTIKLKTEYLYTYVYIITALMLYCYLDFV